MTGEFNSGFLGYGFSMTGRSHEKSGKPCQDNHILRGFGKWQLVAVADGVGSANMSDIGSREALEALAFKCESELAHGGDARVIDTLRSGFRLALERIYEISHKSNERVEEYDTTLTACIYDGENVFIGHVGDGGVIGMDKDGKYHLLTEVQKGDAWNEVCPLRAGEKQWVFKKAEGSYSALLLFTDGLLDHAVPSLLFGQDEPIYRAFVNLFLPYDSENGENSCSCQGHSPVNGELSGKLERLLAEDGFSHLTDDLTAAAVWKKGRAVTAPCHEYLKEPDWEALRKERYYKLYPHLRPTEE